MMKISTEQVSIAASQRYVYQRYMLQVQISYKITKAACNDESSQKKKNPKYLICTFDSQNVWIPL